MNAINKQKFLAELGKLLTFMYEEDRQTALAMYVKMFEDAEDEQALIQALISPTRQAVIVARAYNAKERKLQVQAQSREEAGEALESDATPDFVLAINQVYWDAVPAKADLSAPLENQFSLFEEDMPAEDLLIEEVVVPVEAAAEDILVAAEETVEEIQEAEKLIESDSALNVEALEPEEASLDAESQEEGIPEEAELPFPERAEESGDTKEPEAPTAEAALTEADAVDAFLEDFAIAEAALQEEVPSPEDALAPAESRAEDAGAEPEEGDEYEEYDVIEEELEEELEEAPVSRAGKAGGTKRRPKTALLILFILLAIPITLVGIAILLIPALLFLALAFGAITTGAAALMTAFSGFPVFADILIVLGAALVILALGLLFLWLFIWFIGGAIAGLIRSVVRLSAKWCYEEVPA